MASRFIGTTVAYIGAFGGPIVASTALAQPVMPPEVAHLFVGAWRAVPGGMYAEAADGTRTYPFGQDAVTRFILTADGYGANAAQYRDRANCANGPGPRQCSTQEAEAAFQTSTSYQYRYRLEPDANTPFTGKIVWDVDLAVYPNWRGQTLIRRYEMSPDGGSWVLLTPLPSNPTLGLKVHLERERR
jgi:hypothetical protein